MLLVFDAYCHEFCFHFLSSHAEIKLYRLALIPNPLVPIVFHSLLRQRYVLGQLIKIKQQRDRFLGCIFDFDVLDLDFVLNGFIGLLVLGQALVLPFMGLLPLVIRGLDFLCALSHK